MLKIVFTLIGTFIGAGFASGKEIDLFFFRYGFFGIIGIFFSSFFVGIILMKTLKIIKKYNINNYENFLQEIIKNKRIKMFLNKVINIFLIFSFGVMMSGFCSFVKQEFGVNKTVSAILILTICYYVFQKNINKIIKINNYLIPIIIVIILYILFVKNDDLSFYFFKNGNEKNVFFSNIFFNFLIETKLKFNFFIKAILYSNYNLLAIIPVLVATKKYIKKCKNIKTIPIVSSTIICMLSLCVFLLLSRLIKNQSFEMLNLDMPIIYVVSEFGVIYKYIYACIIGASIFTTAISSGYGYLQKFQGNNTQLNRSICYLIIEAVIFIPVSFSNLIKLLYPFFGCIGMVQSYYILRYKE